MLTLKHFFDNPTWAAAAGYDFNYLDCMSFAADKYSDVIHSLIDVLKAFPETEVRELPFVLVVLTAAIAGVVVWPLIFWLAAFPLWLRCKQHRRKYHYGTEMNDTARNNLALWINRCEKQWGDN